MRYVTKRPDRIDLTWSQELAYVIDLFASDGNLSSDGRHLSLTSKDLDLVMTARRVLALKGKFGRKARGGSQDKRYFVLQFSDVRFYDFLLAIGLTPAKSKTLGPLDIPPRYFIDFFRGCMDGDGSIGSYRHPESRRPQIRLRLCSASRPFLVWVLGRIQGLYPVSGGAIYESRRDQMHFLSFGKTDSLLLLRVMYHADTVPALERKRAIARAILGE